MRDKFRRLLAGVLVHGFLSALIGTSTVSRAETDVPVADVPEALLFASLDWAPYVEADGSGPTVDLVREIFSRAGLSVEIVIFPWNRAISLAEKDPAVVGVLPDYYSALVDAEVTPGGRCLFSGPFQESVVGFVERVDDPLRWESLEDLERFTLGVVEGYVNEEEFDRRVAVGTIQTSPSVDDMMNIKKVAAGRIDGAVIDQAVLNYLLSSEPSLAAIRADMQFNRRTLEVHGLHICFEPTERGRRIRDLFDRLLVDSPVSK